MGAAVLYAAPIRFIYSKTEVCLSVNKARALIPAGTPCKVAVQAEFPTDKKAHHALKRECKTAWKAHKKAA